MIPFRKTMVRALLILGVSIVPPPPGPALAQTQPADTVQAGTLGTLRDRVVQRYQVLPLQNGIVLIPKYGRTEVQSVELAGETIAVNGQTVTSAELRERIGADADLVTRLTFLDPQTRRVLFGLGPSPGAPVEAAVGDTADAAAAPEPEAAPTVSSTGIEGDRVRIGASVRVAPGETIEGDVVSVGGSVRIDGHVTGDAVAVGGSVDLGPEAVIEGDVVVVGGRVHRAEGAEIRGAVNEVGFGVPNVRFRARHIETPMGGIGGLFSVVIWIVVLGLLTSLALLLGRRPIERMEHRVRTSPWKAAAVGLAAQILFFPALVLTIVVLAISVIGIPLILVVPFAILALAIGILMGFAAVAKTVGHGAENRFGWSHASPYVSLLVGLGLLMALLFFGQALDVVGGPLKPFVVILTVFGAIVMYAAWTIGFGVLLLTRFGTRLTWGDGAAAAPPPPSPAADLPPAATAPAPPAGV